MAHAPDTATSTRHAKPAAVDTVDRKGNSTKKIPAHTAFDQRKAKGKWLNTCILSWPMCTLVQAVQNTWWLLQVAHMPGLATVVHRSSQYELQRTVPHKWPTCFTAPAYYMCHL